MILRQVGPEAAPVLAAIHAAAADEAWGATEMAGLLSSPGVTALIAETEAAPCAFVMIRVAADEAEILTLATLPDRRREGFARGLVRAASDLARGVKARRLLLEVAEDNVAARALYADLGFEPVGRRPGYYVRAGGAMDALILSRDL